MSELDALRASIINDISKDIYKTAAANGFHEDYFVAIKALGEFVEKSPTNQFNLLEWFDSTTEQAEIARMHSELSEWIEGARHNNPPDQHLPARGEDLHQLLQPAPG